MKPIVGVVFDPNIFLWIAESVSQAGALNPEGNKTLLAHGLSAFPIKSEPVFNNGPQSLPRNTPKWVFENFI